MTYKEQHINIDGSLGVKQYQISNLTLNIFAASRLPFWENMELCSTNIMRFMLQRFIFHYHSM